MSFLPSYLIEEIKLEHRSVKLLRKLKNVFKKLIVMACENDFSGKLM